MKLVGIVGGLSSKYFDSLFFSAILLLFFHFKHSRIQFNVSYEFSLFFLTLTFMSSLKKKTFLVVFLYELTIINTLFSKYLSFSQQIILVDWSITPEK